MILNTCYKIIGNYKDAEEAAQDVFVKVFKKAHTFRGNAEFSTWLYKIAVHVSLNYLRKRKNEQLFSFFNSFGAGYDSREIEIPAPESDRPDILFEKDREKEMLNTALQSLPRKQRAAFVLHKFEGQSYQSVADILKLSIPSVESLIYRAKKNIQKQLIKYFEKK